MRKVFRWTERDLHDALIGVGNPAPKPPALLNYFKILQELYGDLKIAAYPQT